MIFALYFLYLVIAVPSARASCNPRVDVTKSGANKHVYEDIGCKVGDLRDGHPLNYDCSHIEERHSAPDSGRPGGKCYFKGKEYYPNQPLEYPEPEGSCYGGCYCSKPEYFSCIHIDCRSQFYRPAEGCSYRYTLGTCCPTEYCPKEGEIIHKCEQDGKTYLEGERFYDHQEQKDCVCTKGPDGTSEKGKIECMRRPCNIELQDYNMIRDFNCAPIYDGRIDGCPSGWRCFNQSRETETVLNPGNDAPLIPEPPQVAKECAAPKLACKYGPLEVPIGSILSTRQADAPITVCTCYVPPLVTCRRDLLRGGLK